MRRSNLVARWHKGGWERQGPGFEGWSVGRTLGDYWGAKGYNGELRGQASRVPGEGDTRGWGDIELEHGVQNPSSNPNLLPLPPPGLVQHKARHVISPIHHQCPPE